MITFPIFILAVIGATHIVVDGVIFEPVRNWIGKHLPKKIHELFTCPQCFGFWMGMFFGALMISTNPIMIFACGCAGSFLANLGYFLLGYLGTTGTTGTNSPEKENKDQLP